jgi:hypothetical protein
MIDRRVVGTGVLALLAAGSCWMRVKSRMQHILEINVLWSIDVTNALGMSQIA